MQYKLYKTINDSNVILILIICFVCGSNKDAIPALRDEPCLLSYNNTFAADKCMRISFLQLPILPAIKDYLVILIPTIKDLRY